MEKEIIEIEVDSLDGVQYERISNVIGRYWKTRSRQFKDNFKLKFMYKGEDITSKIEVHNITQHSDAVEDDAIVYINKITIMYRLKSDE